MPPSPTLVVFAQSASQSASLHGKKAITPIIAGTVTGGVIGIAWIIGFAVYFYKRHRREKRAIAAGLRGHRELLNPPKKPEVFIIPPDPALVECQKLSGEQPFDHPEASTSRVQHAPLLPITSLGSNIESDGETPPDTPPHLANELSDPLRRSGPSPKPHPPIHSTTTVHGLQNRLSVHSSSPEPPS